MEDAIQLDPKDPDSNFFIANLYTIKVLLHIMNIDDIMPYLVWTEYNTAVVMFIG